MAVEVAVAVVVKETVGSIMKAMGIVADCDVWLKVKFHHTSSFMKCRSAGLESRLVSVGADEAAFCLSGSCQH
jgi:hypothetical protein